MPKQKRLPFASKSIVSAKFVEEPEASLPINHLVKVISDLGFHQIIPPPVAPRKMFAAHKELARYFAGRFLDVSSAGESDLILPPTHFLSVFKKYLEAVKQRGRHAAKWFYLAPILDPTGDDLETRHELGIFVLGEDSVLANAQLINSVGEFLRALGLPGFVLEINSIGCEDCQRQYHSLLLDHLQKYNVNLCEECSEKLVQNSLTVLGCKQSSCQEILAAAPQIVDFLESPCRKNLVGVLETLDALGFAYTLNPTLGGQLSHERIFFRVSLDGLGHVLGEGTNYAPWSKYLGAEDNLPLLGFLSSAEKFWPFVLPENQRPKLDVEVFLISLGDAACRRVLNLRRELQTAGLKTWESMLGHPGIKTQLKEAQDCQAAIALIVGQKEAIDDTVILRDMRSGMQEVFANERIIEEVKKRLN